MTERRIDPIQTPEEVQRIRDMLNGKNGKSKRDLLLFMIGITSGLRGSDLLVLKADLFLNAKVGDQIPITEKKTGKPNSVQVTKEIFPVLKDYLSSEGLSVGDYLFPSQKGKNKPLTVNYYTLLVKRWCKDAGIKGNHGGHTIRKTTGTLMRKARIPIGIISKKYNHSSEAVTRRYLGIKEEEVIDAEKEHSRNLWGSRRKKR